MTAVPKDPWEEIEALHRRVAQLWDEFYRDAVFLQAQEPAPAFIPEVDVVETPETIRLYVSLPGIVEEDVELQLTPEALTIQGVRHAPFDPEQTHPVSRESRYGYFRRRIRLPSPVDPHSLRAYFSDGMLAIYMARPRGLALG